MFLREKCHFFPYKCYDLMGHSIMQMEVVIWYNQVSNQKWKSNFEGKSFREGQIEENVQSYVPWHWREN